MDGLGRWTAYWRGVIAGRTSARDFDNECGRFPLFFTLSYVAASIPHFVSFKVRTIDAL
jgi:hypothetical protein